MKIAILNTTTDGGAANAARRLQKGLIASHNEVDFFTQDNFKESPWLYFKKRRLVKEQFKLLSFKNWESDYFSSHESVRQVSLSALQERYDLVHVHWVNHLLDLKELKSLKKPIIWTLHDKNVFTGGCTYSFGCEGFTKECSGCPQLPELLFKDFAHRVWTQKKKALDSVPSDKIIFVTPSLWLKRECEKSSLVGRFQVHHIPNGISNKDFDLIESPATREKYQIPREAPLILFLASDLGSYRKGYAIFRDALGMLNNSLQQKIVVLLVGSGNISGLNEYENITLIATGPLQSQDLPEIYNACDFLVLPTLEDNLPNTVIEANLCGLPVLGFNTGGMAELVEEGLNGMLAKDTTAAELYAGLINMLKSIGLFDKKIISERAGTLFSENAFVSAHLKLYQSIIKP